VQKQSAQVPAGFDYDRLKPEVTIVPPHSRLLPLLISAAFTMESLDSML